VTFADEIAGVLVELRADAESLMTDTCVVRRVAGVTVDSLTGKETPTYVQQYAGPCKVQSTALESRTPEVIGHTATVQHLAVHFPVGAFAMLPGDVVEITASAVDPMLAGREFRTVEELPVKTYATAYRVSVEEVPA